MRKRAMSSEKASFVKLEGHRVEEIYAKIIGGQAIKGISKKDVRDKLGKIHSVKGANLKWQIFLYGKKRFERDFGELGKTFVKCIESFPEHREDYIRNKNKYKAILKGNMVSLKKYLEDDENRKNFFIKAFLNNEINYFVIYNDGVFHIFDAKEAVEMLGLLTNAENSKAQGIGQTDDQKVIFKYDNRTVGEIEMRNDSDVHYRQIKFWMEKRGTSNLLLKNIKPNGKNADKLIFYGKAQDDFLRVENPFSRFLVDKK